MSKKKCKENKLILVKEVEAGERYGRARNWVFPGLDNLIAARV